MLAVNSANIWAMQHYQSQSDYFTAPLADSFSNASVRSPQGCGFTTWEIRQRRARSDFAPSRASGCTASGGPAGVTLMRHVTSTA